MNSTPQQESKPLTEFRPFSRLPFELRVRIFREAEPGPVRQITDHFTVTPPRYYQLNSLLVASRESRAEIFRRFSKFEVITPHLFDEHVRKRSSYFRPHIDILQLYEMGERLSAENITQLALNVFVGLWYFPRMIFSDRMNNAAKLYTFLSNHFPALKNLWLIVEKEDSRNESPSSKHLLRMLDVSDGFVYLNLRLKFALGLRDRGKGIQRVYNQRSLRYIKEYTELIAGDLSLFLNTKESDLWPSPGEATLRYWKTRKSAPALMCFITKDVSDSDIYSCKDEDSGTSFWLWVPSLGISIACHKDASPVHKYKGLAQIFDGEPW
ncbi:hypothetical protein EAF00_001264 [Botryotinia globosa]|nr:hypothetical protein EAF00_001264 [Botryotinia globosa]